MNVLEIENLTKSYGSVVALQGLSMSVPQGSVFGLLGPNGSGKTTTLGIILGVLHATSGTVRWFGQSLNPLHRLRIGALLETPNFYPYLTARQNLAQAAAIKHTPTNSIDKVLITTGLLERQHERFNGFSLGMKQRLAIAAALLGQPEVLILDEPTNGLDPQGIAEIRELIRAQTALGTTVIIASHMLDEVEKVCTHVAILSKGQLRASKPISELLSSANRTILRTVETTPTQTVLKALAGLSWVSRVSVETDGFISFCIADGYDSGKLNEILFANGIITADIHTVRCTLESEFLRLIAN